MGEGKATANFVPNLCKFYVLSSKHAALTPFIWLHFSFKLFVFE